jgi:hypothetical protein
LPAKKTPIQPFIGMSLLMIVISDLMGTLTTGSPFLGVVVWMKHNQNKWRVKIELA